MKFHVELHFHKFLIPSPQILRKKYNLPKSKKNTKLETIIVFEVNSPLYNWEIVRLKILFSIKHKAV